MKINKNEIIKKIQKLERKNLYRLIEILAIAIVVGFIWLQVFSLREEKKDSSNFFQENQNKDWALIEEGNNCDDLSLLDLETRQKIKIEDPTEPENLNLEGIFKPSASEINYVGEDRGPWETLFSQNREKAIFVYVVNDLSQSKVVLKEYQCDLLKGKCTDSDYLSSAYEAVGVTKEMRLKEITDLFAINIENAAMEEEAAKKMTDKDDYLQYRKEHKLEVRKWDSGSNKFYIVTGESWNGDQQPVFVFDYNKKDLKKTTSFEEYYLPDLGGAFSPSLSKYIAYKGEFGWDSEGAYDYSVTGKELLLYETDDLSKPAKTFDISQINKMNDLINSVAWSKDEKRVFIGVSNEIYELNLEDGKLKSIFKNENGSADLSLSSSGRFIIFSSGDPMSLKAIDLKDNSVIDLGYSGECEQPFSIPSF